MYYTYMLRCDDNSLYTGYTNDLQKRFEKHLSGKGAKYTRANKPKQLVYLEIFQEKSDALKREIEIKKMGKNQKESLCHSAYEFSTFIDQDYIIQEKMNMREQAMGHALVAWYCMNKRDFPWRRTEDPYAIWISEVMSQQTRISAVVPYHHAFLKKFPNIQALAEASTEEVLKQWEGLGYYSRARNLHRAAIQIMKSYQGELPRSVNELKSLAGVGEYTAAAIASIAFGEAVPAIDGNVLRVYSRIEASYKDVALQSTKKEIAEAIQAWIPPQYASDFTQSLMDLGATICMPTQVICRECPVQGFCRAKKQGNTLELPVKSKAAKKKMIDRVILLARDTQGRWLLRKRTEGLLKGLWEFPGWDDSENMKIVYLKQQALEVGIDGDHWKEVGQAKHVFTHIVWNMEGFFLLVPEILQYSDECEWVPYASFSEKTWPVALQYYQKWVDEYEKNNHI